MPGVRWLLWEYLTAGTAVVVVVDDGLELDVEAAGRVVAVASTRVTELMVEAAVEWGGSIMVTIDGANSRQQVHPDEQFVELAFVT